MSGWRKAEKFSHLSRTSALHNSSEELKMENFLYMRIYLVFVFSLFGNISRYYSKHERDSRM